MLTNNKILIFHRFLLYLYYKNEDFNIRIFCQSWFWIFSKNSLLFFTFLLIYHVRTYHIKKFNLSEWVYLLILIDLPITMDKTNYLKILRIRFCTAKDWVLLEPWKLLVSFTTNKKILQIFWSVVSEQNHSIIIQ